jgi:uncharacterized membrane protein (Fun14 family)
MSSDASATQRVKAIFARIFGFLSGWTGDGPWRSKSVLAALAVVLAGTGLWFSDITSGPPQNVAGNAAVTNAPGITLTNTTGAPAGTHWKWSKPFPIHVRMGASYVAGFFLGWLFRRVLRLILVFSALAIALLAYVKLAGCDMTHTEEQVKRSSEWAQHEATAAKDYLKHMLPSATAGGVGIFLGFRRRSKAAITEPAEGQERPC